MGIDQYKGRVAVVTGASSGIGAAIVKALLRQGLTVVGLARRSDMIEALKGNSDSNKLHAIATDVSEETSILSAFKWIRDNVGGIDILINNAGIFPRTELITGETQLWKRILDVNVLGLSICTKEAVQDMLSRGVDDGFIIHINSIVSHVPPFDNSLAMYSASKHAVSALLEGLRKDLAARGSKIRVGQVSPGGVRTVGVENLMGTMPQEFNSTMPLMEAEDIAEAVIYMLSQHPRVQVYDVILQPTCSPL